MKLSDILLSDVVCKSDGSLVGKVGNVYFDENCKKIVYFDITCADTERLLPFSASAALADAVVTEDTLALLAHGDVDTTPLLPSPLGKKVYTGSGKFRGEITDVIFSSKGKVNSLNADGVSYSPSSFRAFGDVWLLKDSANGRKTPKVPFPQAKTDYKVTVLGEAEKEEVGIETDANKVVGTYRESAPSSVPVSSTASVSSPAPVSSQAPARSPVATPVKARDDAATSEASAATPVTVTVVTPATTENGAAPLDVRAAENEQEKHVYLRDAESGPEVVFGEEGFTPYRVIADYNFLLGRSLTDDIFSYSGEKLASRGARVTVDLVETARRHGKLMELTLSSK